jgi:hypothetical protein
MAVEFMTEGSVREVLDHIEASFGERMSVSAAFQMFVVNFGRCASDASSRDYLLSTTTGVLATKHHLWDGVG